jgi:hypothetical protein
VTTGDTYWLAESVACWDDLTDVPEAELARDIRELRDGSVVRAANLEPRGTAVCGASDLPES